MPPRKEDITTTVRYEKAKSSVRNEKAKKPKEMNAKPAVSAPGGGAPSAPEHVEVKVPFSKVNAELRDAELREKLREELREEHARIRELRKKYLEEHRVAMEELQEAHKVNAELCEKLREENVRIRELRKKYLEERRVAMEELQEAHKRVQELRSGSVVSTPKSGRGYNRDVVWSDSTEDEPKNPCGYRDAVLRTEDAESEGLAVRKHDQLSPLAALLIDIANS